jgi:hypothetical protein
MKRFSLPPLILAATALFVGQAGCASPDCEDTATCVGAADTADAADSSVAADGPVVGADSSVDADSSVEPPDDAVAETTTPPGSDAAADASRVAETGAPDTGPPPPVDSSTPCNPSAPDCANPECLAAFTCVPAVPSGWLGPIALYDQGGGPPAPTPAACAGAFTDDVFDGNSNPTSPALTCGCTCGGIQGSCTNATITVYSDITCTTKCDTVTAPTTSCMQINPGGCNTGGGSAKVTTPPEPTGTSCSSPGTTATTTPPWSWTRVGRGCEITRSLAADGCSANQVCANNPPTGFQGQLCVYKRADVANCSTATGYPNLFQYFGSAADGRSCAVGSCECSPMNATCTLGGAQWFTSSCSGTATPIDTAGDCSAGTSGSTVVWVSDPSATTLSGSCSATGSATSTGSVTANTSSAITVCCE